MVDFRYHLISIVAVFLALGLGILMGTIVLDDALVKSLKADIDSLRKRVDTRQEEIAELDQRIDAANAFTGEVVPWLTEDALEGRLIVTIQLEGSDGNMVGGVRDAIESSGGELVSNIVLSQRFRLQDQIERDRLALITESTSGEAVELRTEAGSALGARLAAAAAEAPTEVRAQGSAQERLRELTRALEDAEFISVDADDEAIVASNSMFLVLAGDQADRPYDPTSLVVSLSAAVAARGVPILVAEPSGSTWGVVEAIREEADTQTDVATVDQGDTVEGQIAVVLGLERAFEGSVGHYGVGPGATRVIPEPAAAP